MKASLRLLVASFAIVVLHALLVRFMAHGHVAHSLLAAGPTLGDAILAAALVVVRFAAVVLVPGALAMAAVLAAAHYLVGGVGSRSTGTSSGGPALAEAEGTGTSMGVTGTE